MYNFFPDGKIISISISFSMVRLYQYQKNNNNNDLITTSPLVTYSLSYIVTQFGFTIYKRRLKIKNIILNL